MRWPSLLALLTGVALAQDSSTATDIVTSGSLDLADASTVTPSSVSLPPGTYQTYSTTITLDNGDSSVLVSSMMNGTSATPTSGNQTVVTTTSNSVTVLVGGAGATGNGTMANATASASSTPTHVVNTQPCNGWAEFCERSYSNITMVAAHNSPFVRTGNAAANQALDVTSQLDDGIRMRT